MMELCSDGHEEVCFESRFCPACSLKEDLGEKIKELEEDIAKLEKDNEDLQATIDAE